MPRRPLTAIVALALAFGAIAGPVAAAAPFPSRIMLPPGWEPEGVTAGRGTTIYVGSLAGGGIWAGDVRTGLGHVLVPGFGGAVNGIEYEAGANRLWAAGGPTPTVRVYDATSGTLLREYVFSPAGYINDVAITDTAIYVTDSFNAWLDVIPLGLGGELPDPGSVTMLPLSGIDFEADQFNANGIVATRGLLIVDDTYTGGLFRVDPATGGSTPISTGGVSVGGADGMELRGSTLYVVRFDAEVVEAFRLGWGLTSATPLAELSSTDLSVPTTVAVQAGRLWVVNARFGIPTTEYWVSQLPTKS